MTSTGQGNMQNSVFAQYSFKSFCRVKNEAKMNSQAVCKTRRLQRVTNVHAVLYLKHNFPFFSNEHKKTCNIQTFCCYLHDESFI